MLANQLYLVKYKAKFHNPNSLLHFQMQPWGYHNNDFYSEESAIFQSGMLDIPNTYGNETWGDYQFLIKKPLSLSHILFRGRMLPTSVDTLCGIPGSFYIRDIEIIPINYENHLICEGMSATLEPTCSLDLNVGVPNISMSWQGSSSIEDNATVSPTETTAYTVSFTYNSGSSSNPNPVFDASCTVSVQNNATAMHNIGKCAGGSVQLCADEDYGSTFLWSTGASTACINVDQPDTYTCTVTSSSCSLEESFEVWDYDEATISKRLSCSAGPGHWDWILEAEGDIVDAGNCTYLWSNGATTNPAEVTGPGSYTVTITDPNCTQIVSHDVPFIQSLTDVCPGNVNSDLTITGGTYFYSGSLLRVLDGATLKLNNCTIYMNHNARIYIKDNSTLFNNGSLLTSCSTWYGITVWGDPNSYSPNFSVNAIYKSRAGGTIEHAERALASQHQGVFNIDDSYFVNNLQSINIQGQTYLEDGNITSLPNSVILKETEFIVNDDKRFYPNEYYWYISPYLEPIIVYQIRLSSASSLVGVKNLSIIDETTDGTLLHGIDCSNGKLSIGDYTSTSSSLHSRFENLEVGIRKNDPNLEPTSFRFLDFVNVRQGIKLTNTNATEIQRCTFDMSGNSDSHSYGILIDGGSTPDIRFNHFSNGARGILINNSLGDYTVYKNTFENFSYAPSSEYMATAVMATGFNTVPGTNDGQGLQFKCNRFIGNTKSITVGNSTYLSKIKKNQGFWLSGSDIKDAANNIFENYCNTPSGDDAFYTDSEELEYTYFYHNVASMDFGSCHSDIVSKQPTLQYSVNYEDACPDFPNASSGTGGPFEVNLQEAISTISTYNLQIDNQTQALVKLVDHGASQELLTAINTATAASYTELVDKVAGNQGFSSDAVLEAFIRLDMGRPEAKAIALAENSPLPPKAKACLRYANLPAALDAYIWSLQDGLSVRVEKEMGIAEQRSQKQYLFNYLLDNANNTKVMGKPEDLLAIIDQQEEPYIRYQGIQLLAAMGQKQACLDKIGELKRDIVNLSDIEALNDLLTLESIGINAQGLSEQDQQLFYASHSTDLWAIYHKKEQGSHRAYLMLKATGATIEAPLDINKAFPTLGQERSQNTGNTYRPLSKPQGWLSLYPNPVKGKLTVEYLLPQTGKTDIKIYNMQGQVLLQEKLNSSRGIRKVDVSSLKTGTYILKINTQSKEFIVQ